MFKFMNYLSGYYEIVCPNCHNKFYLEKRRYREGLICCSYDCMMEVQKKDTLSLKGQVMLEAMLPSITNNKK